MSPSASGFSDRLAAFLDRSTDLLGRSTDRPATRTGRVEVDGLTHRFGDTAVLRDVSMRAEPGELVGLVGPNGAGKTTCLRAVTGALEPDEGAVTIDGVDIDGCRSRESSRLVAVVPQDTTVAFSVSVRSVVEMGRHPYRSRFTPPTADDRKLVTEALARTRTAQFADRPIDEVSGGERQRVVLARAIAQDTPVLVLDEPTANLDVNHQIETLELVRELVDGGKTAIAAIHDLDLAARYCDRLVLLADGAVRRSGPPETVLQSDVLTDVFGAAAAVGENPVTGTPTVTTLPTAADTELPGRVHVLGSGSVGASVVSRLCAAGIEVTVGPVPEGDATAEAARGAAVEYRTVPPYRPIEECHAEAFAELADAAETTVVADPPTSAAARPLFDRLDRLDRLVLVDAASTGPTDPAVEDRLTGVRRRAPVTTTETLLECVSEAVSDDSVSESSFETDELDAENTETDSTASDSSDASKSWPPTEPPSSDD
ncbi:ATP-binding cassette domain-containing protein [Halobacteria archaeon AArc-dxtr1]|nr:ATP-binding cassette domain-containing protein [Halobacteria archaeon AArc-dxtr1]